MVFDPGAAPLDRPSFLAWWGEQSRWTESHGYQDPAVSTPALRAWFLDMIRTFPAMNGPHAVDEPEDEDAVTDYSVGRHVVYAAFAWSKAGEAYDFAIATAQKHRVGFFDASGKTGDVWLPDKAGKLTLAHRG